MTLAAAGIAYGIALRVLGWAGETADVAIPREVEPVLVVLILGLVTDYAVFFLSAFRDAWPEAGSKYAAMRAATAGTARGRAHRRADRRRGHRRARRRQARLLPRLRAGAGHHRADRRRRLPHVHPRLPRALRRPAGAARGAAPAPAPTRAGPPAAAPRHARLPERVRMRLAGAAHRDARRAATRPTSAACRGGGCSPRGSSPRARWRSSSCSACCARAAARRERRAPPGPRDDARAVAARGRPGAARGRGRAAGLRAGDHRAGRGDPRARRASPPSSTGIATLQDELREQPGVAAVVGPAEERGLIGRGVSTSEDGGAARIAVLLDHEPGSATAIDTVDALEDRLPGLVADAGLGTAVPLGQAAAAPDAVVVGLSGETALGGDTVDAVVGDLWRIALAALALNLLFLVIFMRALVAPLYLLAASVLGYARRPRAHRPRLPGAARLRRPHLLRAARHRGAARVARLGLQRLRRGAHLGGGADAAAARGGRGGHAAGRGRDHRRGPDARGELRAARARPAALVPRVRAADGHRRADRHAARALAADPRADLDLRREELVAGAAGRAAAAPRGARRRGRAPGRRRGGGRPGRAGDARHALRADHAAGGQDALHAAAGRVPAGAHRRGRATREPFGLDEFAARVARREGAAPEAALDDARAVLATLDELVDETTMAYVRGQLGEEYAPLFGAPEEERASGATSPCSATTSSTASRRQRADEPLDARGPAQLRAHVAAVAPQRAGRDEHLAGGEPRGERRAVLALRRRRSTRTARRRARRGRACPRARRRAARAAWPRRRAGARRPPPRGRRPPRRRRRRPGRRARRWARAAPRAPAGRARRPARRPAIAWPLEKERTTTRLGSSPTSAGGALRPGRRTRPAPRRRSPSRAAPPRTARRSSGAGQDGAARVGRAR